MGSRESPLPDSVQSEESDNITKTITQTEHPPLISHSTSNNLINSNLNTTTNSSVNDQNSESIFSPPNVNVKSEKTRRKKKI